MNFFSRRSLFVVEIGYGAVEQLHAAYRYEILPLLTVMALNIYEVHDSILIIISSRCHQKLFVGGYACTRYLIPVVVSRVNSSLPKCVIITLLYYIQSSSLPDKAHPPRLLWSGTFPPLIIIIHVPINIIKSCIL